MHRSKQSKNSHEEDFIDYAHRVINLLDIRLLLSEELALNHRAYEHNEQLEVRVGNHGKSEDEGKPPKYEY